MGGPYLTPTEIAESFTCCKKDPHDCENCPAKPYPPECERVFQVTMMQHKTVSKEYNE